MRQRLWTGLLAILALASTRVADAQGVPPGGGATPKAGAPGLPPRPAILNQVVATVNDQPITRGEVINFLSRFPVPPGDEKDMYRQGVEYIANHKLISQYLVRRRVPVTEKDIDDRIAQIAAQMKQQDGRELRTALAEAGSTEAELRAQILPDLGWKKYVDGIATDAELKKYVDANRDVFTRVQVKAGHIFLAVPPDASAAVKETIRQKLLGIKKLIDSGSITFQDAANKYSEDPANKESPNGGDLGYFTRKGPFLEQFAAAAFAQKTGVASDPIDTEYGYHLIKVTDRKPGQPFDFEQNRVAVLAQYATDLQEKIITQERKAAKIDIKPMPADLFPPAQQPPASTAPGAPATKGATPGTAPR